MHNSTNNQSLPIQSASLIQQLNDIRNDNFETNKMNNGLVQYTSKHASSEL